MDGGECGRIADACVSMRVCFDSLCFSSTQQRLADEEDASQLAASVVAVADATAAPPIGAQTPRGLTMGTLRELQELLRVKDERIAELEADVCRRDAEISELRSHLDKFLSVLPFKSPLTPTKPRPRKQRAQGISAEPPLQVLTPLVVVDKSDRLVFSRSPIPDPRSPILIVVLVNRIMYITFLSVLLLRVHYTR